MQVGLRRDFTANGFTVLRSFFSPREIAELSRSALDEFERDENPEIAGRTLGKVSFHRSANLWRRSKAVRRFAFDARFASVARDLLEVQDVRLVADDLFFKKPRSRVSSWHADRAFLPIDSDKFLSIWIPLQATTRRSGTMAYAAKSHRVAIPAPTGRLRHERTSHLWYETALRACRLEIVPIDTAVGDVLVHHCRTYHMAYANNAATPRIAYGLHFMDAAARFAEPVNDAQRQHVRECDWSSLRPGDLVDVPTAPLVRAPSP